MYFFCKYLRHHCSGEFSFLELKHYEFRWKCLKFYANSYFFMVKITSGFFLCSHLWSWKVIRNATVSLLLIHVLLLFNRLNIFFLFLTFINPLGFNGIIDRLLVKWLKLKWLNFWCSRKHLAKKKQHTAKYTLTYHVCVSTSNWQSHSYEIIQYYLNFVIWSLIRLNN